MLTQIAHPDVDYVQGVAILEFDHIVVSVPDNKPDQAIEKDFVGQIHVGIASLVKTGERRAQHESAGDSRLSPNVGILVARPSEAPNQDEA